MPGPRDADNILRTGATDLTADVTLTHTLASGNKHINPLSVVVLIPQKSSVEVGGGDTLKVTARFTDTDKKIEVTHTDLVKTGDTYPQLVELPLPYTDAESLEVVLDVTDGGADGVNFGKVQVWLERSNTHALVPVT